ncbi:sensor domain-containing diguanylate cyclase [Halomonas denitrificans]|uniref:GGDEF domain-containing protein n=1 Tax=Halomonas TaxID=2745 RepID=UPI001C988A99|nr:MULTISPECIES: diguanylate cyclase [Halomonas]MBY5927940.1 sensor domain-containing diguanylate cyclase [Halomonas sp. DP8Y7-3]MCA0976103.1 sensor domain-containing diguanylate cyclase [Halomonas denitrificans]
MSRIALVLTLLVAVLAATGLIIKPVMIQDQSYIASWSLLLAVSLGQAAWYWRGVRLSAVCLAPVLAVLLLGLASYLLPEGLIPYATLEHWAARLPGVSGIDSLRPPLIELFILLALAGGVLGRTRASLATPLLQSLSLLLLITELWLVLNGHTDSPQNLAGTPASMALMTLLLGAQFSGVVAGWRHTRPSILRSLLPSLALVLVTILVWHQQRLYEDRRLQAQMQEETDRLSEQLSNEVTAHLEAVRRFASFWSLLDVQPTATQWQRQAERYHRDFAYFLNIAYVEPDGTIRYVYPRDDANLAIVGINALDVNRPYIDALSRALREGEEGHTGVVPLLQGMPGMIYYLPIISDRTQQVTGAAAMVLSLPVLADQLYAATRLNREHNHMRLAVADNVIRDWPTAETPGPWTHDSVIALGRHELVVSLSASSAYLLAQQSRQPAASLSIGLLLAYLLYMVVFGHHRMSAQHTSMFRSNEELRREVRHRTQLQREVEWLAGHDELTLLPNRRLFLTTLQRERQQRPLAVLLCDIDHFKSINDQLGHQAGDEALRRFARVGALAIPADAVLARYGGEEFVVLLVGDDADNALEIAETLRQAVMHSGIEHADGRPMTVSVGVATHDDQTLVPEDLLHRADVALYRAKRNGRNRIETDA